MKGRLIVTVFMLAAIALWSIQPVEAYTLVRTKW